MWCPLSCLYPISIVQKTKQVLLLRLTAVLHRLSQGASFWSTPEPIKPRYCDLLTKISKCIKCKVAITRGTIIHLTGLQSSSFLYPFYLMAAVRHLLLNVAHHEYVALRILPGPG